MKRSKVFGAALISLLYLTTCTLTLNPEFFAAYAAPTPLGEETFHWPIFWKEHKRLIKWRLQYDNGLEWINKTGLLEISHSKIYENNTHSAIKTTMTFRSEEPGKYRLIMVFRKQILKFVEVQDQTLNITYLDHTIIFDYSDLLSIPGLILDHGTKYIVKDINGTDLQQSWFWLKIQHNNVPGKYELILDPVTIGTGTSGYATHHPPQRKVFHIGSYWFAFYSNGSDMVYETSNNGSVWNNLTVVRSSAHGRYFSLRYYNIGGTDHIYYVWASGASEGPVLFRRGNVSGTSITWGTERTVRVGMTYRYFHFPDLDIRTDNSIQILYSYALSTYRFLTAARNPNNDGSGSWVNTNLKTLTSIVTGDYFRCGVQRMNGNRSYLIGSFSGTGTTSGFLWNGTHYGSEENIGTSMAFEGYFGAVTIGDNVSIAYSKGTGAVDQYSKMFKTRVYGVGWGSAETIFNTSGRTPSFYAGATHLSLNYSNMFVAFWIYRGRTSQSRIQYANRSNGSWSYNNLTSTEAYTFWDSLSPLILAFNNTIGLMWNRNELSPYSVRFEILDLAPAIPPVNYTVTFYFHTGGYLLVNGSSVLNGSSDSYVENTVLNLTGVPDNSTYQFENHTYDSSVSYDNPFYLTLIQNYTTHTYFGLAPVPPVICIPCLFIGLVTFGGLSLTVIYLYEKKK